MDQIDLLVIDDDPEMGAYIQLALASSGWAVAVFTALPGPQAPASRAALIDLMLAEPGAGLRAVERLAQDRAVVVMTGLPAEHPTVQAARAAGASAVLSKPFTLADIRECAREHLGTSG